MEGDDEIIPNFNAAQVMGQFKQQTLARVPNILPISEQFRRT